MVFLIFFLGALVWLVLGEVRSRCFLVVCMGSSTGVGGGWCPPEIMNEEVREMLAKLMFSEEQTRKLFTTDSVSLKAVGREAWDVGK